MTSLPYPRRGPRRSVVLLLALGALCIPLAATAHSETGQLPSDREITLVLEPGERPPLRLAFPAIDDAGVVTAEGRAAARDFE
jgi:hypothetical protein